MVDEIMEGGKLLKGGETFTAKGRQGFQSVTKELEKQNAAAEKSHRTSELQAHLQLEGTLKNHQELVKRGVQEKLWAKQQEDADALITAAIEKQIAPSFEEQVEAAKKRAAADKAQELNDERIAKALEKTWEQQVADAVAEKDKEDQEEKDRKKLELEVKKLRGETGLAGLKKSMGNYFREMIDTQKDFGDRLKDVGDAFADDLSFLGDMMGPLAGIPGINTATTALKALGGGILSFAVKFYKKYMKAWVDRKKEWVKDRALAMRTFIMNKAKNAWDKMIEMKRGLKERAAALKGGGGKGLHAKLPPKARLLAMFLKSILSVFVGLFAMIAAFGKEVLKPIQTFFRVISTKVSGIFKGFKLPARLTKAITSVKTFFGSKGPMGRAFAFISNIFSKIGKVIGKLLNPRIIGFMRGIGGTLGKLFWPITVLMGAWESLKGFIAGFKDTEGGFGEKVIGGIYTAMQYLVDFLIMWPLDLLKDMVAWIGDKLGFDTSSLKEFSFSDMWKEISDKFIEGVLAVVRFVKAIAMGIGAGIAALWPGGEGPMEAFKRKYDEVMATPAGKKGGITLEQPEATTGQDMEEAEAQAFTNLKEEEEASWWQFRKKRQQAETSNNIVTINEGDKETKILMDGTTPEENTADATF